VALDGADSARYETRMPSRKSPASAAAAAPVSLPEIGEAEAGGILSIDLDAIAANWAFLARRTVPAECAAVVKADAYGCGLERVTTRLVQAGCKTFFVATIGEGRRVRALAPEAAIYVLDGLLPGSGPAFADAYLRPVIGNLEELAEWDTFVSTHNWRGGMALHVDTGMNRLGIGVDEAAAVAARLQWEQHGITLLMSHFAAAEAQDHPLNDKQIQTFRELRRLFRGVPASLANSSGIFLGAGAHCDLVRPGVALYGANPLPGRDNPMQPVVELKGRILQIRNLERGATVGYGATWTAKRPSRIAVVAVGYADGYSRSASAADGIAGGEAVVAGRRCPLAGRVSMDLMAIDVTDVDPRAIYRGDLVTLIGDGLTLEDVAGAAGTIAYEVLVNLGRRFHRAYRG
jgi:alanine racemase